MYLINDSNLFKAGILAVASFMILYVYESVNLGSILAIGLSILGMLMIYTFSKRSYISLEEAKIIAMNELKKKQRELQFENGDIYFVGGKLRMVETERHGIEPMKYVIHLIVKGLMTKEYYVEVSIYGVIISIVELPNGGDLNRVSEFINRDRRSDISVGYKMIGGVENDKRLFEMETHESEENEND